MRHIRDTDGLDKIKHTMTNKYKLLQDMDSGFFIHYHFLMHHAAPLIEELFEADALSVMPSEEKHVSFETVVKLSIRPQPI